MKTKSIFLGVSLMLSVFSLKAQWIDFPVVFHVLYFNSTQNLPDSVLQHQLDVLNEDFNATNADIVNVPAVWQPLIGDMDITFTLATTDPQGNPSTGIERRQTTSVTFPQTNAHSFAAGGLDPWPDSNYINIWVYNLPSALLGFATFPDANPSTLQYLDMDYIMIGRNDPNNQAPYNLGRITTHEMAHFFGLQHIWGDDGSACTGTDNIADTPNQADENYGNPGVGTIITDACTPTAPGVMWMNYLDFTDDAAMCFFTQGQVVALHNNINTYFPSFGNLAGIRPIFAEDQSRYSVFPSPSATGIFQVNRKDYNATTSVEVYDLQGRGLMPSQYFENGSTTMQIDLSAYPDGIYSVVIRSGEVMETKRVVIAR